MIATTATEAAIYDEMLSGGLRSNMVSLFHKSLPLALFLEVGDLGYPPWSSTSKPASNAEIKSSLGLGIVDFTEKSEPPSSVLTSISSNQSSAITNPQNAVSYFPEFRYETYWRLLERVSGGSNARFKFKKNKYSTYKNRTHFSLIWMRDGMLSMNLTDSLTIRENLWQDWHIAPLKP